MAAGCSNHAFTLHTEPSHSGISVEIQLEFDGRLPRKLLKPSWPAPSVQVRTLLLNRTSAAPSARQ